MTSGTTWTLDDWQKQGIGLALMRVLSVSRPSPRQTVGHELP